MLCIHEDHSYSETIPFHFVRNYHYSVCLYIKRHCRIINFDFAACSCAHTRTYKADAQGWLVFTSRNVLNYYTFNLCLWLKVYPSTASTTAATSPECVDGDICWSHATRSSRLSSADMKCLVSMNVTWRPELQVFFIN